MGNAAPALALPAPTGDLAAIQTALTDLDKVEAGINALREQFGGVVFDVRSKKGMEEARAARQLVREPRYRAERIREEAKAPLLALGRRLDAEAKRIKTAILAIEEPIDRQIKEEEERVERERQEAVAREQARVAAIRKRIDEIRGIPLLAAGKSVKQLEGLISGANGLYQGFDFGEFDAEATSVLVAAQEALHAALRARVQADAEAEQLRRDREALAAQQREQEARQRALDEQERKNREAAAALERMKPNPAPTYPVLIPADPYPIPEERMTPALVEADDAPAQTYPQPGPVTTRAWRPTCDQLVDAVAMHFGVTREDARQWLTEFPYVEEV